MPETVATLDGYLAKVGPRINAALAKYLELDRRSPPRLTTARAILPA